MVAIPLSVDLWIHYIGFTKAVQEEGAEGAETIRRLTLPFTEHCIPSLVHEPQELTLDPSLSQEGEKQFSTERERAWDHGANVGSLYNLIWQSLFQLRAQICSTSV